MRPTTVEHQCDLLNQVEIDPCTIVIFGGSGDLTRRKLIPSLFSMYRQQALPNPFTILACGRTDLDENTFRKSLSEWVTQEPSKSRDWNTFADNIHYHQLTYDESHFQNLSARLDNLDREKNTNGNRIFNLAVPPELYPVIAGLLGKTGLGEQFQNSKGWSRIVIEKPFGRDLQSARELNTIIQRYFQEEQIFRIDHYLAKETIQNVLVFRFANAIFEPIWNTKYIDHVAILASEKLGIGSRGGYYDSAGVLRDMFQNHLMQLLVLIAMEPPAKLESEMVQDEKAKVIRSLRPFDLQNGSRLCLGQYSAGKIDGDPVRGYLQEAGIAENSLTPTFAQLKLYIDNWRWQGVPFFLASGKRLPKKETKIIIQFKEVPHRLFGSTLGDTIGANRLQIETYPEEAIRLSFQAKSPGSTTCLRSMTMDFAFREKFRKTGIDAYGKILLDCIRGDHMLFWRQDGIELSWAFLTPVLEACEKCDSSDKNLHHYPAGSWGPDVDGNDLHRFIY